MNQAIANLVSGVGETTLKMLLLLCCAVAAAYASNKTVNIGFGYQFECGDDWKIANAGNQFELTKDGMPPIEVQWEPATSTKDEIAHQQAREAIMKHFNDLALRYILSKVTESATGTKVYESELAGTLVDGGSIQLHYYTLLLEGRLLSITGGRINDRSNVVDAWSIAISVHKTHRYPAGKPESGALLTGQWWSEGHAYLIFGSDGSVEEYTEPSRYFTAKRTLYIAGQ